MARYSSMFTDWTDSGSEACPFIYSAAPYLDFPNDTPLSSPLLASNSFTCRLSIAKGSRPGSQNKRTPLSYAPRSVLYISPMHKTARKRK